jgi:hypothetical protein
MGVILSGSFIAVKDFMGPEVADIDLPFGVIEDAPINVLIVQVAIMVNEENGDPVFRPGETILAKEPTETAIGSLGPKIEFLRLRGFDAFFQSGIKQRLVLVHH